uniref:Uncharacterized protein n=1 Tax=Cavia porcellus TaxID=10141 RepID=A0A286XHL7_CAVPO
MSVTYQRIEEELRMVGAIQAMNGMHIQLLGGLWRYFFISQMSAISTVYIPIAVLVGYPFWSSLTYLLSGMITILTERRQTKFMIPCMISINIFSLCISVIGLILLLIELAIAIFLISSPIWQLVSIRFL